MYRLTMAYSLIVSVAIVGGVPRPVWLVLVASALLLVADPLRTRLVPWLVSYAVGALLGATLATAGTAALAVGRAHQRPRAVGEHGGDGRVVALAHGRQRQRQP